MIVPDSIDPIIAWRVWRYGDLLGSLNGRVPTLPGVPQAASCYALRDHEVPDEQCSCGIYALPSLEEAARKLREESSGIFGSWMGLSRMTCNLAIGQVYLWGKVVEHVDGWRAQFAYPKTISTSGPAQMARLAKLYGIEEEPCSWEELFEQPESNLWDFHSGNPVYLQNQFSRPGLMMPIAIDESPKLPAVSQSKKSKPNRSVPRQLRGQVEQKQEIAKSDFWKYI